MDLVEALEQMSVSVQQQQCARQSNDTNRSLASSTSTITTAQDWHYSPLAAKPHQCQQLQQFESSIETLFSQINALAHQDDHHHANQYRHHHHHHPHPQLGQLNNPSDAPNVNTIGNSHRQYQQPAAMMTMSFRMPNVTSCLMSNQPNTTSFESNFSQEEDSDNSTTQQTSSSSGASNSVCGHYHNRHHHHHHHHHATSNSNSNGFNCHNNTANENDFKQLAPSSSRDQASQQLIKGLNLLNMSENQSDHFYHDPR